MDKIKVAQIGVTHEHAAAKMESLRKMTDLFEIVGVVDDMETTKHAARFLNSMKPFEGLRHLTEEELFREPGLQAVLVEVPNTELVPTALRCMEHNLPMHLDKPAGEDLALFQTLLKGCKAKQLPLQMGYMFRGNPAIQFCLKIVREGWLGDVFEVAADMDHSYGGPVYQEYIGKFRGGIMFNLGCHLIDFVVAMMGAPIGVTPFLKSTPDVAPHIRNNCMSVLEYPHATVVLRSCSKGDQNQRRLKITGTKGWVETCPLERFDNHAQLVNLFLREDRGPYGAGYHVLDFGVRNDRYREQLVEFAGLVRGTLQNPYSYEHDELVEKVLLAASGYTTWEN